MCSCSAVDGVFDRAALTATIEPLITAYAEPVCTLRLRAHGFRADTDLIAFAQALERHTVVQKLAIVRAEGGRASFAIEAASTPALQAALRTLNGFEVSTTSTDVTVDAALLPLRRRATADESPSSGTGSDVLSFRSRQRIPFHAPTDAGQADQHGVDHRTETILSLPDYHTIVVYPLDSFAVLNDFHGAIRSLVSVYSARVRRFSQRTLYLDVVCSDVLDLSKALRTMAAFHSEQVIDHGAEIEVQLCTTE